LQLLSLILYAKFSTGKQVDGCGSDLLDAVAVKSVDDMVDSEETEEMDSEDLLAGIDDENVREAFRVRHKVFVQHNIAVIKLSAGQALNVDDKL